MPLTDWEKELAKRLQQQPNAQPDWIERAHTEHGDAPSFQDQLMRAMNPLGLGRGRGPIWDELGWTPNVGFTPKAETRTGTAPSSSELNAAMQRIRNGNGRPDDLALIAQYGTPEMVEEATTGIPPTPSTPPSAPGDFGSVFETWNQANAARDELGEGWSVVSKDYGWGLVQDTPEQGLSASERLAERKFEEDKRRYEQGLESEATQGLTPWQQAEMAYRQQQYGNTIDQQQAAMISDREAAIRGEQAQSRQFAFDERMAEQNRQLTRQAHLAELQANPRSWIEAASFGGYQPTTPNWLAPSIPGQAAGSPINMGAAQGARAPMTPQGASFNRFTPTQQEQVLGYQSFLGTDPQDYLRGQRRISPPGGGGRATYTR